MSTFFHRYLFVIKSPLPEQGAIPVGRRRGSDEGQKGRARLRLMLEGQSGLFFERSNPGPCRLTA